MSESTPIADRTMATAPRWVPWAILGAGLAARLAHNAFMADTALVVHPSIDPAAYLARAHEILGGKLLPDDVFFQDPLYPYLLAGMLAISGGAKQGPYALHAVAGALTALLIYVLGRRWWNWRVGAAAGALAALYTPFLYLDGLLEKNAWTLLAFTAALAAFPDAHSPRRAARVAASGFALGCGALLRGNFLLLVPLFALFAAAGLAGSLARRAGVALLFGAAAFAPIAPFTIHNYRASGDFILTTAQAGTAFYLGNNPQNTSGGIHHVSFNRQIPEYEADDWKREAERRSGRALTRKEVSAFWMDRALEHISKNPGWVWWFGLAARKAELIVNTIEIPDNAAIAYAEAHSPLVRWNPLRFGAVAALGLAGLVLACAVPRRRATLLAALGVYGATMLFFPVSDRFRAPIAVGVLLGAGAFADVFFAALRSRAFTTVALLGAGAAASGWIAMHEPLLQPPDSNLQPRNAQLKVAHDEAAAWNNAGEWSKSEELLRAAMRDEWLGKKARLSLDLAIAVWGGRRDANEAEPTARKAIRSLTTAGESVPDGYRLMREMLEARGAAEEARYWKARADAVDAPSWLTLVDDARAADAAGDSARATGLLSEVVLMDQSRQSPIVATDAYILLARVQMKIGDRKRAKETAAAFAARGGALPDDLKALLQ